MKQQGLTLLEVMVALAIFALTATAIMKATSEHLHGINTLEDLTFATWVANNQLNDALVIKRWPPENNEKGDMEMAGANWYWQQKVTDTQDPDLKQVEIIVAEDQQMQNVVTSVTTFLANPKPARRSLDGN